MRFSSGRDQRGLVALLLAVAILTTVATTLVIRQANAVRSTGNKIALTNERLEAIRLSLVNFVAVNGRLPCPEPYASVTGAAFPQGSSIDCGVPAVNAGPGAVPWKDLGLLSSDVLDGWGRKISYRVFSGDAIGSVGKQIMVDDPLITPPLPSDKAFVLISHGETGYGAWSASGIQTALAPVSVQEVANAGSLLTYYRRNFSGYTSPPVPPTDPAFFDDLVIYMTVNKVIAAAGL